MAFRLTSALIWTLLVITVSSEEKSEAPNKVSEDKKDSLLVSKELLRFMMGCSTETYEKRQQSTVDLEVDSEDATKSQQLTVVDLNDLQDSLKHTLYSDSAIRHIVGRIQSALEEPKEEKFDHEVPSFRHTGCSVTNEIEISVPPQELNEFNERFMQLLQQNSRILLEQFNTLVTFKLNQVHNDVEKLMKQRSKLLKEKLEQVLSQLEQIQMKPVVVTASEEEQTGEVQPGVVQPEVAGQPEGETQPEVEAQPEVETQPEVEVHPEGETQPEVEAQPEVETQPEVEVHPEGETQPEVEVHPEDETQPEVEEVQPEGDVLPEAGGQPEEVPEIVTTWFPLPSSSTQGPVNNEDSDNTPPPQANPTPGIPSLPPFWPAAPAGSSEESEEASLTPDFPPTRQKVRLGSRLPPIISNTNQQIVQPFLTEK